MLAKRIGFTLVELLVVIAIIAILFAFLLPATRRVGEAGGRAHCQNNLKQLMLGLHTYHSAGGSTEPQKSEGFPPGCFGSGAAEDRLSWLVAVLPYIEQDGLFRKFDLSAGYAANLPAAQTELRILLCPSAKEAERGALTHYVALSGLGDAANGFMRSDRPTALAAIADGASNTIALLETRSGLGPWARGGSSNLRGFDPADVPIHGDGRPFGGHATGMNAAMTDGSVRFLSPSVDPAKLAAAVTIAGGETVHLD